MTYKTISVAVGLVLAISTGAALAEPVAISQRSPDAKTFSFFTIDAKRASPSVGVAKTRLSNALATYGITPCYVLADANAAIDCPLTATWHMSPTPGKIFSYSRETSLQVLPPISDRKSFNKDRVYKQVWAANFTSPVGSLTASEVFPIGAVVFTSPVTEFSFKVDAGQVAAQAVDAIQFTVNGITLEPQPVSAGSPVVVGVSDPAGFITVEIQGIGGQSGAYVADQFAFVPAVAP